MLRGTCRRAEWVSRAQAFFRLRANGPELKPNTTYFSKVKDVLGRSVPFDFLGNASIREKQGFLYFRWSVEMTDVWVVFKYDGCSN